MYKILDLATASYIGMFILKEDVVISILPEQSWEDCFIWKDFIFENKDTALYYLKNKYNSGFLLGPLKRYEIVEIFDVYDNKT